jgi:hypothetical protein
MCLRRRRWKAPRNIEVAIVAITFLVGLGGGRVFLYMIVRGEGNGLAGQRNRNNLRYARAGVWTFYSVLLQVFLNQSGRVTVESDF